MRSTADTRDEYLARLRTDYDDFAVPLRTDALHHVLGESIRREIEPHVEPVRVDYRTALERYAAKPGTLIVAVRLYIHKDTIPHIAVLDMSLHRPDVGSRALFESLFYRKTAVIPLDLPADQIAARVSTAIKGLYLYAMGRSH